ILNTTSTSACELATPTISCTAPAPSLVPRRRPAARFLLSVSISSIGHCSSCLPSLAIHIFLGNVCTPDQPRATSSAWLSDSFAHAHRTCRSCARRRTTWTRTRGRSPAAAISGSRRRARAPPARRRPPRRRTCRPCSSPGACPSRSASGRGARRRRRSSTCRGHPRRSPPRGTCPGTPPCRRRATRAAARRSAPTGRSPRSCRRAWTPRRPPRRRRRSATGHRARATPSRGRGSCRRGRRAGAR
ncbi:Os09g0255333, partial [Oryza sativa Japonica Group]